MLHLVRILSASLFLAFPLSAFAQQVVDHFDEPCMAAFGPLGYPQFTRFVPNEASPQAKGKLRGVVHRALTWQPSETIKICFRSGTQKARARVVQFASEWMRYANLKLDFGDPNSPRACQGDNHEAIKIDFMNSGPKAGYWSIIGTNSRKADHSLNLSYLGEDELPKNKAGQSMPLAEARRLVLHEFGHALGLFHEHQSPRSGCAAEYEEEAVFAFGALRGWPPDRTIMNFKQLAESPEFNATEIDRKSIMHYSLPPWIFKAREKSPCWVPANFELSERDKSFMARVYPKGAPQVATGPATSVTRGAKPSSAASANDKLVDEYRRTLQEAGIAPAKIESLTKEFRASLSK